MSPINHLHMSLMLMFHCDPYCSRKIWDTHFKITITGAAVGSTGWRELVILYCKISPFRRSSSAPSAAIYHRHRRRLRCLSGAGETGLCAEKGHASTPPTPSISAAAGQVCYYVRRTAKSRSRQFCPPATYATYRRLDCQGAGAASAFRRHQRQRYRAALPENRYGSRTRQWHSNAISAAPTTGRG